MWAGHEDGDDLVQDCTGINERDCVDRADRTGIRVRRALFGPLCRSTSSLEPQLHGCFARCESAREEKPVRTAFPSDPVYSRVRFSGGQMPLKTGSR